MNELQLLRQCGVTSNKKFEEEKKRLLVSDGFCINKSKPLQLYAAGSAAYVWSPTISLSNPYLAKAGMKKLKVRFKVQTYLRG